MVNVIDKSSDLVRRYGKKGDVYIALDNGRHYVFKKTNWPVNGKSVISSANPLDGMWVGEGKEVLFLTQPSLNILQIENFNLSFDVIQSHGFWGIGKFEGDLYFGSRSLSGYGDIYKLDKSNFGVMPLGGKIGTWLSFIEFKNELYAANTNEYIYKFNRQTNKFDLKVCNTSGRWTHGAVINNNLYWITVDGDLYLFDDSVHDFSIVNTVPLGSTYAITQTKYGDILIGDSGSTNKVYKYNINNNTVVDTGSDADAYFSFFKNRYGDVFTCCLKNKKLKKFNDFSGKFVDIDLSINPYNVGCFFEIH